MIFKNSKLLLIVLVPVSVTLLATLIIGVYNIRAKNQKISELLNLADHATEVEILARSIRAVQNDVKEDLETFDGLVLSDSKLVALIENIEEAGQTLGLETEIASIGKTEDKKGIVPDIIRIAIDTHGSWSGTLSFLRALENLPHRIMVDKMNLSREEVDWHLTVTLLLYSFD